MEDLYYFIVTFYLNISKKEIKVFFISVAESYNWDSFITRINLIFLDLDNTLQRKWFLLIDFKLPKLSTKPGKSIKYLLFVFDIGNIFGIIVSGPSVFSLS